MLPTHLKEQFDPFWVKVLIVDKKTVDNHTCDAGLFHLKPSITASLLRAERMYSCLEFIFNEMKNLLAEAWWRTLPPSLSLVLSNVCFYCFLPHPLTHCVTPSLFSVIRISVPWPEVYHLPFFYICPVLCNFCPSVTLLLFVHLSSLCTLLCLLPLYVLYCLTALSILSSCLFYFASPLPLSSSSSLPLRWSPPTPLTRFRCRAVRWKGWGISA